MGRGHLLLLHVSILTPSIVLPHFWSLGFGKNRKTTPSPLPDIGVEGNQVLPVNLFHALQFNDSFLGHQTQSESIGLSPWTFVRIIEKENLFLLQKLLS